MNENTRTIFNFIVGNLLSVDENINKDGTVNFDYLDADIHLAYGSGTLKGIVINEDIDAAFDAVAELFKDINDAIDKAYIAVIGDGVKNDK